LQSPKSLRQRSLIAAACAPAAEILRARILAIACSYEDANDLIGSASAPHSSCLPDNCRLSMVR
jgi:hypothetical protein